MKHQLLHIRFLCCLFVFLTATVQQNLAQDIEDEQTTLETLIENIVAQSDEDLDFNTLLDELSYYYENPLDLNTASREELENLVFLSDFQIYSLLDYKKRYGPLLTLYELKLIVGFDKITIKKIAPFIAVADQPPVPAFNLKNSLKFGRHQLFIRSQRVVEQQAGFAPAGDSLLEKNPNARYKGTPYKTYTRYGFHYKKRLYFGFTAENDPGEEFFSGSNPYGYDYYSAHLLLNRVGIIKTLALGDYQLKFGQGLTLWSGMGFGKNAGEVSLKRFARGIQKYSSTNENKFLRGAATTLSLGDVEVSGFYSRKKIDANIVEFDSTKNEAASFSSFGTTGYHRLSSEIEDENAVDEQVVGGNITFKQEGWKVGITGVHGKYSATRLISDDLYKKYDFSGKETANLGIDYLVYLRKASLFGEAAIDLKGNLGSLAGLNYVLTHNAEFSMLYRDYSTKFQNLYGNAIGENSCNNNEKGLYTGIKLKPASNLILSGYYDNFRFNWLNFRVSTPSWGHEYLVQLEYLLSYDVKMYIRYKTETKKQDVITETGTKQQTDVKKSRIRYHISYVLSEQLELRNRIVYSFYEKEEKQEGYIVYQDIIYEILKVPVKMAFRYALFETSGYDARIYAYENDLLYAFSLPAYYGRGSRSYLLIKYSPIYNLDCWIKYGITYYTDREVISSGLNEIQGNKKSELKVQVRFRF